MTTLFCAQGHVIDAGLEICSRCNGRVVNAPVAEEAVVSKPQSKRAPRKKVTKKKKKKLFK